MNYLINYKNILYNKSYKVFITKILYCFVDLNFDMPIVPLPLLWNEYWFSNNDILGTGQNVINTSGFKLPQKLVL